MTHEPLFDILVMEIKTVHDLPDGWTEEMFKQILVRVDYEDLDEIAPADLREMTVMALQDLKPEAAAEMVLAVLTPGLSAGSRKNLAQEMKDQRLWEEYANSDFHAALFMAAVLLNLAFPRIYPQPDIARLTLEVRGLTPAAVALLSGTLSPPFMVRLLADGLDEHSSLKRMYTEQLAGKPFPEAANVIWQILTRSQTENRVELIVYASWYWVRPLKNVQAFQSAARATS